MTALAATPAWNQITQPQRHEILGERHPGTAGHRRGDDRGGSRHAPAHQAE